MGAPRLDRDASRVMDDAHAIALRHGHASIDVQHLLAALVADDVAGRLLSVDRPTLTQLVEAQLSALAPRAPYRDAPGAIERGPSVDAILTSAAKKRGLALFRPVTVIELVAAARTNPRAASLLLAARPACEHLDDALENARLFAHARGDDTVALEHVLRPLTDEAWLVEIFAEAGADLTQLRRLLDERLAGRGAQRDPGVATDPELAHLARRTTTRAERLALRPVPSVLFLGIVFRDEETVDALFERRDGALLEALQRRVDAALAGDLLVGDDAESCAEGELDVLLHDDDITTMEFVVGLLADCFAMSAVTAIAYMREAHEHGIAAIGRYPAEEARKRLADARRRCAEHAVPLRLSVRAVKRSGA